GCVTRTAATGDAHKEWQSIPPATSPSPQQQEPSASTAASLVPYCESVKTSQVQVTQSYHPRFWDMPSLDDTSPTSPHSKPVSVNGTTSLKTNSKRNLDISPVFKLYCQVLRFLQPVAHMLVRVVSLKE
ncbi:hypothetical protein L9F63_027321, partial [Diploptera punctata]